MGRYNPTYPREVHSIACFDKGGRQEGICVVVSIERVREREAERKRKAEREKQVASAHMRLKVFT